MVVRALTLRHAWRRVRKCRRVGEKQGLVLDDPKGPDVYLPSGLRATGPFRFGSIAMTFDEAEDAFCRFAMDQGYPGELL